MTFPTWFALNVLLYLLPFSHKMDAYFKFKFENVLFRICLGYFYNNGYTNWLIWNLEKKCILILINLRPKTANSPRYKSEGLACPLAVVNTSQDIVTLLSTLSYLLQFRVERHSGIQSALHDSLTQRSLRCDVDVPVTVCDRRQIRSNSCKNNDVVGMLQLPDMLQLLLLHSDRNFDLRTSSTDFVYILESKYSSDRIFPYT